MNRSTLRLACLAALVAGAAACDFSPAVDIETPAFEPAVVVRAVLAPGQPAVVRLTVSGDPLAAPVTTRLPSATPAGASVMLVRDGRVVDVLAPRAQTCYVSQQSRCNPETGQTETERVGPYDCSAFAGTVPVEAGVTYTIRSSIPGLPAAEATVTVPVAPQVSVAEEGAGVGERSFRVRVRDVPGRGTRYALTVFREYVGFTTQVCRVGGPRDTTFATPFPYRYQTRFATSDPALLADVRVPAATLFIAPFTDATFEGGELSAVIRLDAEAEPANLVGSSGVQVQVATLSPTLYEAFLAAPALFRDEDPFAEPSDLPGNVGGGLGLVGAAAPVNVVVR